MMNRMKLAAACLGLVALTPALAHVVPAAAAGPLGCEIREASRSGGVTLQPVVVAEKKVSGSYLFTVESRTGGGRSSSTQGGDFSLRPGEEAVLSEVSLGLARGARYDAELTLDWNGEAVTCERAGPSR